MLAAPHCYNFRNNGDCDLFRRDRAEIEAGRSLELGHTRCGNAAFGEPRLQRISLLAAADEGNVVDIDRKRR